MVADAAVRADIRDLFEGLIPVEVIDAYDRLLTSDGCAKEQAETLVGDPGLVAALTDLGMAQVQPHSPANPSWFRAATPDMALQGVLAGHQTRLARDQKLLLDEHRRLADAQARFGIAMNDRLPAHLVSVLSDRAAQAERLWRSQRRPSSADGFTNDRALERRLLPTWQDSCHRGLAAGRRPTDIPRLRLKEQVEA